MCVTSSKSELSNTLIYAGEAEMYGRYVHVLAYQNTATTTADEPNCMLLPIPAKTMSKENIIDTTRFPNFLRDISNASYIPKLSIVNKSSNGFEVFSVGSYTVALAVLPQSIKDALEFISEDRRPIISDELLQSYADLYPDHYIALCCWRGKIDAEPLLYWYEPLDEHRLFIPTMDAHDGGPPLVGKYVSYDHVISVGSSIRPKNKWPTIKYINDLIPKELLPAQTMGTSIKGLHKNEDLYVDVDDLSTSWPRLVRGPDNPPISIKSMQGWV